MMQPMGGPPQFGPPVEMDGQQWMGPVAEQMVPLNCPPGMCIQLSIYPSPIYLSIHLRINLFTNPSIQSLIRISVRLFY